MQSNSICLSVVSVPTQTERVARSFSSTRLSDWREISGIAFFSKWREAKASSLPLGDLEEWVMEGGG